MIQAIHPMLFGKPQDRILTIACRLDIMAIDQRLSSFGFQYMATRKERDRLAAILKELQETSGCRNAAELARRIGIPEQRFRSYMRGQNSAQGESLSKIEAYMGLKEGQLWDKLYADNSEIQSATELVPLFKSLNPSEKKQFLRLAMEAM